MEEGGEKKMIICPWCTSKINTERYNTPYKCPSCKQKISNLNVISCIPFPECVSKVRYIGLNSEVDANSLLKMMQ